MRIHLSEFFLSIGVIGWDVVADFSFNINLQPLNHQS